MNILYCGDSHIVDGLTISILSLIKQTGAALKVYILTMDYDNSKKKFHKIMQSDVALLELKMRAKNPKSTIEILDVGELFRNEPMTANKKTFFTPYCMLRLYVDKNPELPEKILYLDTDIVCLNAPEEFYNIDNSEYEIVGVLDRYGGKIIRLPFTKQKYFNSGVLLLNLKMMKKTGMLKRARQMCRTRLMIMPDQTALNFCAKYKKIVEKKFNDQKEILPETVFRHFSNTFIFFPYFRVQAIKPWHEKELHEVLKTHEFDDVLTEWKEMKNLAKNQGKEKL